MSELSMPCPECKNYLSIEVPEGSLVFDGSIVKSGVADGLNDKIIYCSSCRAKLIITSAVAHLVKIGLISI